MQRRNREITIFCCIPARQKFLYDYPKEPPKHLREITLPTPLIPELPRVTTWGYRPSQEDIATRVRKVSSLIRGWSHYFKIAHNFCKVAGLLDHLAHWAMVKAISRKNDISSGKVHKKFYHKGRIGVTKKETMVRFSDTKMSLDYRGPVEYEPGNGVYLEDHEWEANLQTYKNRPEQSDLKLEALERDQYQCRNCGSLVIAETSELDHIIPVHQFANFKQANTLENVQRYFYTSPGFLLLCGLGVNPKLIPH